MVRFIKNYLISLLFLIVFAKRLPNNTIPIEYKLEIVTNLGNEGNSFNFKGSVLIRMECTSPTNIIILHSKNLKIDEGNIILRNLNQTEDSPAILGTLQDIKSDFLILTLSKTLQVDYHYEVELHFEGDIGEEKMGYYRSSYLSERGIKKWIGVTYFKPKHARRAFPCFDELTFKAKFTISLGRSTRFYSLSNMPLMNTEKMENKPGWEWDHFQTTPPMSTYNVGFTVIDFKHVKLRGSGTKVDISMWGRDVSRQSSGQIVMGFSSLLLHAFESTLKMKYPLPKLDIVAIPDYAVPVRECWGLIFWQEDFLIEVNRAFYGVDSMGPVGNQILRQWFENLVTIKSWSDVWFAEGFCLFVLQIADFEFLEHDLGLFNFDITPDVVSVFNYDSFNNTRAISNRRNRANAPITIPDDNQHKKTALLFRMFSYLVGHENLRKVIQQYLTMYKYKNAGSEELLQLVNNISEFRDINMNTVMGSWFSQAGFPLITVTRNYERGLLVVTQERFFRYGELIGMDSTKWWIPLTYTTECEMEFKSAPARKWLTPNEDSVIIEGRLSPADWVIFNIDASGLYMVNYDEKNWNLIIDFLNTPFFNHIPSLNRVLLIDNAARLAWVERLEYKTFLDLLKYVRQEDDPQAKYTALSRIDDLNALLKRKPIHGKFMNYARKILQRNSQKNLKANDRYNYMTVLAAMLLRQMILCIDDAAVEHSWREYQLSKEIADVQYTILRSLVCCKNQTLLRVYLEKSLGDESNGNEDITLIIIAIAGNRNGFDLAIEFFTENFETIYKRIFPHVQSLSPIIIEIARHIVSEHELTWLKNFIHTNRQYFLEVQTGVVEALEIAKSNVQWHHKHYRTIETYLNDKYGD